MTNGERIELLLKSLPYSEQIKNIELWEESYLKFKWRGTVYRYSGTSDIEVVDGGMLIGCDKSLLMEAIINKTRAIDILQEAK